MNYGRNRLAASLCGNSFPFNLLKPSMTLQERLLKTGLPLVPFLDSIVSTLHEQGRLILTADPGSGKSTLVPIALLEEPGSIIMLEPRRIAAIGIASRMADILEDPLGKTVGYSVRMDRHVSEATRIEVITEGLLVRRLQAHPELPGVSTIIFDEFHERSLFTDLSLALVLDLCRIKPDLNILIMSATMDSKAIAERLNETENRQGERRIPILTCPGRIYPIETEYRPPIKDEALSHCCARTIKNLIDETPIQGQTGDLQLEKAPKGSSCSTGPAILVFLPGRREIQVVSELLSDLGPDVEVLPLHGSLPLSEQRRVLRGAGEGKRRVILATNIAETSLTVPEVSIVVDTGLVRLQRYHLRTGMDRLSLELASTQSVDQRRGRAGRLGPGRCIRLWEPQEERPTVMEREIRRLDLSSLVLECALWGALEPDSLPWLEEPPRPAWDAGKGLLLDLGAIDAQGKPTPRGKQMAHLALHPRLAMLALAGKEEDKPELGAILAALLSERDPSGIENEADIRLRLEALTTSQTQGRFKPIIDLALDILRRLGVETRNTEKTSIGVPFFLMSEFIDHTGELLARAFPDRICKKQENGTYRFITGREATIRGRLSASEWLVAPDVDAGERSGAIYLAAPVSKERALEVLSSYLERDLVVIWNGLIPKVKETSRAGRLVIQENQRKCNRKEAEAALVSLLTEEGLEILPWDEAVEPYTGVPRGHHKGSPRNLLHRIRFYIRGITETNPEMGIPWSDENLVAEAELWLAPFIWNGALTGEGPIITAEALLLALKERLGWDRLGSLDREVPLLFISPAGTARPVDYSSGEPVVSIKIQEVYGLVNSPRIMGIPLTFELLSPAGRPIQKTRDLERFWSGSYSEVRKEMRGRYPKHYWPEDPSHAHAHR